MEKSLSWPTLLVRTTQAPFTSARTLHLTTHRRPTTCSQLCSSPRRRLLLSLHRRLPRHCRPAQCILSWSSPGRAPRSSRVGPHGSSAASKQRAVRSRRPVRASSSWIDWFCSCLRGQRPQPCLWNSSSGSSPSPPSWSL
jgi:hypothetical protein